MKYFSMFTGVGGFELGISRATKGKARCVGYSEVNPFSNELLKKKFPKVKNYGDATKIKPEELPDFDVLCGGFPCQSFSIAGKRLGFQDTRGTLFFDIARIIKVKRPRNLFLENVKGILNHDGGRTFTTILATLDELGYNVEWEVLNSKHFGVPQNRERVFIIGHLREESSRQILPIGKHGVETNGAQSTKDSRKEIAQANRVYNTDGVSPPTNRTTRMLITSHSPRSGNPKKGGTGPLESSEHCFTLDRTPHFVNNIRRLTPLECERLQGFPDGWTEGFSDTQRYKMMGNAVTVNVIEAVAEKLFK